MMETPLIIVGKLILQIIIMGSEGHAFIMNRFKKVRTRMDCLPAMAALFIKAVIIIKDNWRILRNMVMVSVIMKMEKS